jgi:hypothetical protein
MLRLQTQTGWYLITHPDHAHLAGQFAASWGNELFAPPEPRAHVLRGIFAHDDGWAARDALPTLTREGKPAAFSTELVGKYSAFEEIDLQAYLAVRREAVQRMAQQDACAAILISMHTHNLLTDRADRSTIRPEDLPWLDAFLVEQSTLQRALREQLFAEASLPPESISPGAFTQHFRLLQACDNLSLLSCVDYVGTASLLWPLALRDGTTSQVQVTRTAERTFRLTPYPLAEPEMAFTLRARFLPTLHFASNEDLQGRFAAAPLETLTITITA